MPGRWGRGSREAPGGSGAPTGRRATGPRGVGIKKGKESKGAGKLLVAGSAALPARLQAPESSRLQLGAVPAAAASPALPKGAETPGSCGSAGLQLWGGGGWEWW